MWTQRDGIMPFILSKMLFFFFPESKSLKYKTLPFFPSIQNIIPQNRDLRTVLAYIWACSF